MRNKGKQQSMGDQEECSPEEWNNCSEPGQLATWTMRAAYRKSQSECNEDKCLHSTVTLTTL